MRSGGAGIRCWVSGICEGFYPQDLEADSLDLEVEVPAFGSNDDAEAVVGAMDGEIDEAAGALSGGLEFFDRGEVEAYLQTVRLFGPVGLGTVGKARHQATEKTTGPALVDAKFSQLKVV